MSPRTTGLLVSLFSFCCFANLTHAEELGAELHIASKTGREFLVGLFDESLGLLPEFRGHHVYWLYHDNYLAAKVLAATNPSLADRISQAIRSHGERVSGKIEIVFSEAKSPLPFRHHHLVTLQEQHGKTIKTERIKPEVFRDWKRYADLLLLASIANAGSPVASSRSTALAELQAAMQMWDGKGFRDAVVEKSDRPSRKYATYKLALAVLAHDRLSLTEKIPTDLVNRLLAMQAKSGGWITDYRTNFEPVGKANVETTCLAILACDRLATSLQQTE